MKPPARGSDVGNVRKRRAKTFPTILFLCLLMILGSAVAFYGNPGADANGGTVRHKAGERSGDKKIITAAGTGRIMENTKFGRMMARRAALSDARRNILLETRKINGGVGKGEVSGYVGPHSILSERTEGNIFRVEISAWLENIHVDN